MAAPGRLLPPAPNHSPTHLALTISVVKGEMTMGTWQEVGQGAASGRRIGFMVAMS